MKNVDIKELILYNKSICVSGFHHQEEIKIKTIIKELGGDFSKNLTRNNYCLIVKRVGSDKYHMAINISLPIVMIDWLLNSSSKNLLLSLDDYCVKIFTGLVISCTQLTLNDRSEFAKLICDNGGVFSGTLEQHKTTHLIAVRASGSNLEKYETAKLWGNIAIVSPSWIIESVRENRL